MVETVKKPSSNRSAKERRNMLFRVLDGVLSMAHKKKFTRRQHYPSDNII